MARRQPRLTKRERKALAAPPLGPLSEPSDRLRELAARHGVPTERLRIGGMPGMERMSDVISEWAAPILGPLEDAPILSFRAGLSVAALIWNAASDAERTPGEVAAEVAEVLRGVGGPLPEGWGRMVEELVESRRVIYADDPRVVMETEAEDVGDDRRMRIVSGLPGTM